MRFKMWLMLLLAVAPLFRLQAGEPAPFDFYGKQVHVLKLFGQQRWGDAAPGLVTGSKIYHAAGVLVDRSSQPNHIYVADTGNNRILGFNSYDSPKADLIFGQPDEHSSAANGDSNIGFYGPTAADKLCLTAYPFGTNAAEQWMRVNFDTDSEGNLYVPDIYNNRVLMYRAPFSTDKTNGKGDTIADMVWGQDDFAANGINRGQGANVRDDHSLFISRGGFDHVAARGVSVDQQGNVWIADTFNYRVLRFPKGSTTADLVIGQSDFTSGLAEPDMAQAGLTRLCTPTIARVNPQNGELWVVDEHPGGFPARILVYAPPFINGMAASRVIIPQQRTEGDYAPGMPPYKLTHLTGMVFNPVQTDDWIESDTHTHRYRDGVCWIQEGAGSEGNRVALLDNTGNILLAIGAPDTITRGNTDSCYGGCSSAEQPYSRLGWTGGMFGFDTQNNIYLADESKMRISRFALPYRVQTTDQNDVGKPCLPAANGGLMDPSPGQIPGNSVGPANVSADRVGAFTFGNQLVLRDERRYMVWNNYMSHHDGDAPDFYVGQPDGTSLSQPNLIQGRGFHAIDPKNKVFWTRSEHERLMLYALPLQPGSQPLRTLIPLYWADDPDQEIDYQVMGVAFDPSTRKLWIADVPRHRLLRITNPDEWNGKLLVDCVLGQNDKSAGDVNRGQDHPDAGSFGDINDIRFDKTGNLFVVDNTYELHDNGRVVAFRAADLAAINTMFPALSARLVYVATDFNQRVGERQFPPGQNPFSPVCLAFNSRNELVIGNDGYPTGSSEETRQVNQLFVYRHPLQRPEPDAIIELPLGAPGEISFDDTDNLIVQDHTWNKLWILNFDTDQTWLRALRAELPSLVVTTTTDVVDTMDGRTSLREALAFAQSQAGPDTITFAPTVTGTITLASELAIDSAVTITGPSAHALAINANHAGRVFNVSSAAAATVSISNLTLTGGSAPTGGGIYVASNMTLQLTNCTLFHNTSTGNGGGIANNGTLSMTNCTLSSNQAASGGGIANNDGTIQANNSTLALNSAATGGGIYNFTTTGGARLTLGNSILQTGSSGVNILNSGGTVTSTGHNISSDAAGGDTGTEPGGLLNGTGDLRNTDPQLGPLAANGGPTLTHALRSGSPAINAGGSAPATDQRGYARVGAPDIGAFEFSGVGPVLVLNISPLLFSENAGANAARGTLARSGSRTAALTVNLVSSDTTEATVPSSVVIPAGAGYVTFPIAAVDDTLVDGPQKVTILATAPGYTPANPSIIVADNEAYLTLTIAPQVFAETEGTHAATGTITRNTPTTYPLVVKIDNGNKHRLTMPLIVTIPAGHSNATFAIGVLDDNVAEGPQRVKLAARSKAYPTVTNSVTILDNEAKLTMSVSPAAFSEGAGAGAAMITITRNTVGTEAITLLLSSSNTRAVTLPPHVIMPAGAKSVSVPLTAINNSKPNATQSVTLTATATPYGYAPGSAVVMVTDDD